MKRNYKTVSEWKKAYRDKEKLMNDRGYHEVQPREFYRAIFPVGSLQGEIGDGKGNFFTLIIQYSHKEESGDSNVHNNTIVHFFLPQKRRSS